MNFFDVKSVCVTVWGYPLSYLELVGTVFCLWSVWLISRRNILTWPVGIVSVVLYAVLFYQIQLYSDALEQVYYLVTNIYGWWYWRKSATKGKVITDVAFGSRKEILFWLAITGLLSAILGALMTRIHLWLPALFREPASLPFLDALTTVMSFVATWLMITKRIECWIYWIVVDVIGVGLYLVKEMRFLSLLYAILLVLAARGLVNWNRARKSASKTGPMVSLAEEPS